MDKPNFLSRFPDWAMEVKGKATAAVAVFWMNCRRLIFIILDHVSIYPR
jgi:hypothetical protein